MDSKRIGLSILSLFSIAILFSLISTGQAQKQDATYRPVIPKTWDEQALSELDVPLADPSRSPKHMSADDYYRIPVRPIYKSYPKYHPDREPSGYRDSLKQRG